MTTRAIVLDANILIRAVLGVKVSALIADHAAGVNFLAPDTAFQEVQEHLPAILSVRGAATEDLAATLRALDALASVVGLIDILKPLLRAGELDLMVGTESADEPGWISKRLAEDMIVVAASDRHPVFQGKPTLRDLSAFAWALQPPGTPTRDWLDHTLDRHRLPRPRVQVETTMLLMLPTLIVQTGLLRFISRHHLQGRGRIPGLREVPVKAASMRRRVVVTYRDKGFLSPPAPSNPALPPHPWVGQLAPVQ